MTIAGTTFTSLGGYIMTYVAKYQDNGASAAGA
jgi:hypothetical protein